jgi:hypothetical protein
MTTRHLAHHYIVTLEPETAQPAQIGFRLFHSRSEFHGTATSDGRYQI